ncbi:hypothetical protein HDU93_008416 [Gonapodya sp. JEL0774]|nr:hypothetical protein HDU93_008416 [Gonapodya sp. JEL0774]
MSAHPSPRIAPASSIVIRPIAPFSLHPHEAAVGDRVRFGAEVLGCDIDNLDPAALSAIHTALSTHQLLIIRDQSHALPSSQFRLALSFDPRTPSAHAHHHGDLSKLKKGLLRGNIPLPDWPQVVVIGNDANLPPRITTFRCIQNPSTEGRPSPFQTLAYDDGSGEEMDVPLGATASRFVRVMVMGGGGGGYRSVGRWIPGTETTVFGNAWVRLVPLGSAGSGGPAAAGARTSPNKMRARPVRWCRLLSSVDTPHSPSSQTTSKPGRCGQKWRVGDPDPWRDATRGVGVVSPHLNSPRRPLVPQSTHQTQPNQTKPNQTKPKTSRAPAITKDPPHAYQWVENCRAKSHGLVLVSEGKETPYEELPEWEESKCLVLPLVWSNPLTHRPSLQLHGICLRAFHTTEPDGSVTVLDDLVAVRKRAEEIMRPAIAKEFVLAVRARKGDVLVWDNWTMWHSVTSDLSFDAPEDLRIMHQCNLAASVAPEAWVPAEGRL